MGGLALALLVLAIFNLWRAFSLAAFCEWLLSGAGAYWLMIVGAAIGAAALGTRMQISGSVEPMASLSNAELDKRWIQRSGGRMLSASNLGLSLVALRLSQNCIPRSGTPASPGESIGFYDLMTWLGTFATFVVVVATALVAMYVKRRDDETQHSSAVMAMRQAWIDKLRLTLSGLMARGQTLRGEANRQVADKALAAEARGMLREVELQLNPTEGHHAVLLKALRAWLHEAGIEDHFRGEFPKPLSAQTDFDTVTEWLVALGQLVLKIEWVVTSLDRSRVPVKAGRLWNIIVDYEERYATELAKVAPEAILVRKRSARTLVEGASPVPPEAT